MARIPIGLQLWSVREDCAKDLPGTLAKLAEMGYEGVELAGYYDRSAAELRKMFSDLGLQIAGAHVGINALSGEELEKTIQFHQELGNTKLIVPSLPAQYIESKDACLKTAEVLDEVAGKLKPFGMQTGFHNHHVEVRPFPEGGNPLQVIFDNSSSDVIVQLDIGHASRGGADPVEIINRYPGRAKTVHVKEYDPKDDTTLVGEGVVPWETVFSACESVGGTEWYIVEHERYSIPPMESVAGCLKNLKKMGK